MDTLLGSYTVDLEMEVSYYQWYTRTKRDFKLISHTVDGRGILTYVELDVSLGIF